MSDEIRVERIKSIRVPFIHFLGLYRSRDGLYIHSDVNASFNIMKVGIEDCLKDYPSKLMLLSPIIYRSMKKSPITERFEEERGRAIR